MFGTIGLVRDKRDLCKARRAQKARMMMQKQGQALAPPPPVAAAPKMFFLAK